MIQELDPSGRILAELRQRRCPGPGVVEIVAKQIEINFTGLPIRPDRRRTIHRLMGPAELQGAQEPDKGLEYGSKCSKVPFLRLLGRDRMIAPEVQDGWRCPYLC